MRVGVLGPLQVEVAGHLVDVGGPRPRRLVAALVAHAGETVSTDALVDAVWGERPPRSAVKTLQAYMTRLRAALDTGDGDGDGDVIQTVAPGYRLTLPRDAVDANAFTAFLESAAALRHVHGFPALGLLRRLRPVPDRSADGGPSLHAASDTWAQARTGTPVFTR